MFAIMENNVVYELSEFDPTTIVNLPNVTVVTITPAHGTVEVEYTYDSGTDTFTAPPYVLADYKRELTTETYLRKQLPVTINGVTFLTSETDVSNIAMLLQSSMTSYSYTMADNSVVTFTEAELTARFNAIMDYHNACVANQGTLNAALDAASDPADVDLDAGWPSTVLTL